MSDFVKKIIAFLNDLKAKIPPLDELKSKIPQPMGLKHYIIIAAGVVIVIGIPVALMAFGGVGPFKRSMTSVNPQMPPPKIGDHYGDWTYDCANVSETQTLCSLIQTLTAKDSNQAIARFSLTKNPNADEFTFSAVIPLGIDIASGINMSIDQNSPVPLTLVTCTPGGCISNLVLSSKLFETMRNGKSLTVSFKFRGAEKLAILAGSLNGFAVGSDALAMK